MNSHEGFYGLIQFCPRINRFESINVGVYLFSAQSKKISVKMVEDSERVQSHFGKGIVDEVRFEFSLKSIRRRLELLEPSSESDIADFATRIAGKMLITAPMSVAVTSSEQSTINFLFNELVDEPRRERVKHAKAPDLSNYFDPLNVGPNVMRNLKVQIPTLGTSMHVPFAYDNAVRNYIKPHGFSTSERSAMKSASAIAANGYLLSRHPVVQQSGAPLACKLIVVANVPSRALASKLRAIVEDFSVDLVLLDQVDDLVQRVRDHARTPSIVVRKLSSN